MKKMKLLMMLATVILLVTALCIIASAEEPAYVAQIGEVKYESIDDAIASWTSNSTSTLTLLDDVTLSDVIKLKSTENHTLNLGTYTMTAAEGKNAIEITAEGRTSESYALTVNADATDPGGIVATGKACIYYKKVGTFKDRPIIAIKGGVFTGSYAIQTSSNGNTNALHVAISGGTFNGNVSLTKTKMIISGGTFHGWINCTGDSTAYRLIKGGTFKQFQFFTTGTGKFSIGTDKDLTNVGVYVDDNGYMVVGGPVITEPGTAFKASASYSGCSSYLQYSSAKANGLYYTSIEQALADNTRTNSIVTVYVNELDLTGTAYKGTIMLPYADSKLAVTFAEGTEPAWKVGTQLSDKKAVYTETVVNGVVTRYYSVVTVTVSSADGGAVAVGRAVEEGKATLIADPATNYYFVNWTSGDTVLGVDEVLSFDPTLYTELKANFAPMTPEETPTGSFTKPNKIVGLVADALYTVTVDGASDDYTADAAGEIPTQDAWYGKSVSIVKKASDGTRLDSAAQTVELPVCYFITVNYGNGIAPEVIKLFEPSLTYPTPKTVDGKIFMGWYDDEACTVPHDFNTAVSGNAALYAKYADYNGDMKEIGDAVDQLKGAASVLQTAIDTKADAATVAAALQNLENALQALEATKDNYIAADEQLKAELKEAIEKAKQEAIGAALKELEEAIDAYEEAKDNYIAADAQLKAELEAAIEKAKQEAIAAKAESMPYVGENGNWWIGQTDTGLKAVATEDGTNTDEADTETGAENEDTSSGASALSTAVAGTAIAGNSITMAAWSILRKRRRI